MNQLSRNLRHLIAIGDETAVAARAGVDQTWLNRVMNPNRADGIKEPRDSTLRPLADFFGVSPSDLKHADLVSGSTMSHSVGIDENILSSSIVSVMKALDNRGLEFDAVVAAPIIAFAYRERMELPADLTKAEYALFDRLIEMKLRGDLHVRQEGDRSATSESKASTDKVTANKPKTWDRKGS